MPKSIQTVTDLFAELPGLGPRQARRIVQFLLRANPSFRQKLAAAITALADTVSQCSRCFRYDETGGTTLCSVCADEGRDTSTLMVVEKDVDAEGVEAANIFHGHYFILGSLMPLANTRKTATEPRTAALKKRIAEDKVREVVLAFATTPEGDYTAQELKKELQRQFPTLTVAMLGRGLSLGAEIEYADQETLRSAFDGRH